MIKLLREIIQLFKTQKLYLFLFIGIICFYLIFFLMRKNSSLEKHVDPDKQRIETLLKEAPQNPQEIERKLTNRPHLKWVVELFTLFFMSSFAYGVWLGTVDLKKLFRKEELIPQSDQTINIAWGIADIVKVIILFFSFGIALNLAVVGIKIFLSVPLDSSNYLLINTVILDLAAIFFMISIIYKMGAGISDLIGFRLSQFPFEEFWWGIRTYFLILPVFAGILIVLVWISNLLSYEPPAHPLVEILLQNENTPISTIVSSLLVACVVGPIVEEIFFRGFFYPALRKYFGAGWTMIITAFFFAGVHGNLFAFLPVFFLGFVLCYLYEKRRNLICCISLHIVHNSAFLIYFFIMKSILFA